MNRINLISFSYFLNSFFPTILMCIYFIYDEKDRAAEIGVLSSLVIVLLNIFSSNKRNLILASGNKSLIIETLLFRFIFFIPIFALYFFYLLIFDMFSIFNILLFIIFFSLWVNEILIVNFELNKTEIFSLRNIFIITTYFILIQFQIHRNNNFLEFINFIFIIILLFPLLKVFLERKTSTFINLDINLIKNAIKSNIFSFSFISSFGFLISVFIWRFFLIKFFDKDVAIYYFIIFAIASFPGTFINNFLGVTILKDQNNLFLKYFTIICLIVFLIIVVINYSYLNFNYIIEETKINSDLIVKMINISLIGTIFMSLGMYFRSKMFFLKSKNINNLFKADFFYGILISLIVPFIGIFISKYLYFSYFIGSFFSFFYYLFIFKFSRSIK